MMVQRLAAFSNGRSGGNPAGVLIGDSLPDVAAMQRIAREVGYSETAFAAADGESWRVRYFSPESEVPFCGHATIALGAVLAMRHGEGIHALVLNDARITVEGRRDGELFAASLQSPPTRSAQAGRELVDAAMRLFALEAADLDPRLPAARIHAGADHLLVALADRRRLAHMDYDLAAGRALMAAAGLVTIALVQAREPQQFDVRNAFASGGVLEDPATGAAAAALAGYLRDLDWPHGGFIRISQGDDMGMSSRLDAAIPASPGSSIKVSGTARLMD